MLSVYTLNHSFEKKSFLDTFDIATDMWVVSDIRSKLEIQNFLINKFGYVENSQVLRASELWKHFLVQSSPDLKIIKKDYALIIIENFLHNIEDLKLDLTRSAETVYNYITEFISIFETPEGYQKMMDWLSENPNPNERWGHWFKISFFTYDHFKKQNIISSQWLSGFVITKLDQIHLNYQRVIFDLGSEILLYEAELIKNMSQKYEVTAIVPHFENRVFSYLKDNAKNVVHLSPLKTQAQSTFFKRFLSAHAEVKFAVDQIDSWLQSGVRPDQILVAAPNIEVYWPVLQTYLAKKNIPYQKNQTAQASTLKSVVEWISNLNCILDEVDPLLLEQSYFNLGPQISFDQFKKLYTYIYDSKDLKNNKELERHYQGTISLSQNIEFSDFILHAFKYLKNQDSIELILNTIKDLFLEILPNEKMSYTQWLKILTLSLSQKELSIETSFENGINVVNLWSCGTLFSEYRIYLGLTEEQLKSKNKIQITQSDAEKVLHQLGFQLSIYDDSASESELLWLKNSPIQEDYYTYAHTNFSGELEIGSLFWIQNNITRLSQNPDEFDQCDKQDWIANYAEQNKYVERDFDIQKWPKLKESHLREISVTQVERLLNCSFQFFTDNKLKLMDLTEVDLDINAQDQGQILHLLLEKIISTEMKQFREMSLEQLEVHCLKIVDESQLKIEKNKFWHIQFKKIIKLVQNIIYGEAQYFEKYQSIKVFAKEHKIQFTIQNTLFKGKVDRLDISEPNLFLVIDYKTGLSKIKNYQEWEQNSDYQLLLYTYAIESGAIQDLADVPAQVVSAQYYYIKKAERKGGFLLADYDENLFSVGKKKNKIDSDQKNNLKQQMTQRISKSLEQFHDGIVLALPARPEVCDNCQWRTLCRAPHLN